MRSGQTRAAAGQRDTLLFMDDSGYLLINYIHLNAVAEDNDLLLLEIVGFSYSTMTIANFTYSWREQ